MSLLHQFQSWPKARRTANGFDVCCPAHEDNEPSLSISESGHMLLWHCKAGCTQDTVRQALEDFGIQTHQSTQTDDGQPFARILSESRPAAHTEAEFYLRGRGISTPDMSQVRFHPNLLWKSDSESRYFAAMILPAKPTPTGQIAGIQRIYLQNAKKAPVKPSKKSLGTISGNAFWSGTDWSELAVTEGVETGFAVAEATGLSFASTLGAKNMEAFNPPVGCKRIYIFGDYDPKGTGRQAAENLALRISGLGINVRVIIPEQPTDGHSRDWLDVLNQDGPAYIQTCLQRLETQLTSTSMIQNCDEWPDPLDLQAEQKVLPEFDLTLMPSFIRDFLEPRARMAGFIPSMGLAFAFLTAGAAAGRSFIFRSHPNSEWSTRANFFGFVVARASSRKSAAYGPFVTLLNDLEKIYAERVRRERIENEPQIRAKKALLTQIERDLKKCSREDEDLRSRLAREQIEIEADIANLSVRDIRLTTGDATVEKLVDLLDQNPTGLALCRDEIGALFSLMRKSGWEMLRDLLLEAFNGDSTFKLDRIGRGTTIIPATCMSVFGTTQPSRLRALLKGNSDGGDGLLSRFQFVIFQEQKPTWKPSREEVPKIHDIKMREFLLALADQRMTQPHSMTFNDPALARFEQWQVQLNDELGKADYYATALEAHLGKYPSLLLKLAGIIELASFFERWPTKPILPDVYNQPLETTWPTEISDESLRSALSMLAVLRAHAEHLYRPLIDREHVVAQALLKKVTTGKVFSGTRVRDIKQAGWAHLDDNDDVELAVSALERNFILRVDRIRSASGKGRPSDIIVVNPKVHQRGKK